MDRIPAFAGMTTPVRKQGHKSLVIPTLHLLNESKFSEIQEVHILIISLLRQAEWDRAEDLVLPHSVRAHLEDAGIAIKIQGGDSIIYQGFRSGVLSVK